jgi:predicted DsbA family dithiol-disulfide isomerase
VRAETPELALAYLHRLHEAFYARGRDIRDPEVLADEAEAAIPGLDRSRFLDALASPGVAADVWQEFAQTAALGVTGYPTLLGLAPGRRPAVLSLGCLPFADVVAALDRFLASAAAAPGDA